MLLFSNIGGHCMLLSSGQACGYPMKGTHSKYGGFAYSSAYAYSAPPGLFTLEQYALASQLGLSDDNGESWKPRRLCTYAGIETRPSGTDDSETPVLVSDWVPLPNATVRTILVPPTNARPNYHLRAHRISVAANNGGRNVMTADGSFAIRNVNATDGRYLEPWDAARGEGTRPRIVGNYDLETPEGWASGAEGAFAVCKGKGAVGIRSLEGEKVPGGEGGRRANLVNADPNSNLVENRTTIPTLQHTIQPGQTVWYVTAVFAKPTGEGDECLAGWENVPEIPGWLKKEMGS